MDRNKKIFTGVFIGMLLLGVALVSASSYHGTNGTHKERMSSGDFEKWHEGKMSGDSDSSERHHSSQGMGCSRHGIKNGGNTSNHESWKSHKDQHSGNHHEEN